MEREKPEISLEKYEFRAMDRPINIVPSAVSQYAVDNNINSGNGGKIRFNHVRNARQKQIAIFKLSLELIKYGWCKEVLAEDINKKPINFNSTKATSFCLGGAIQRSVIEIRGPHFGSKLYKDIHRFEYIAGINNVDIFNDNPTRTQEEVIALMRSVITTLETGLQECQ